MINAEIAMKKSRFTDAQILGILKQGESGVPVADLCREHGISNATYYNWRSKFGGMDASLMSKMKAMAWLLFSKGILQELVLHGLF